MTMTLRNELTIKERTFAEIAARVLANETEYNPHMTATEVQTANGEIMRIHPLLNHIVLMKAYELASLVKSIKRRELLIPVTVDAEGVLIDGRCRIMACELAGVPPRFEPLPEDMDPRD